MSSDYQEWELPPVASYQNTLSRKNRGLFVFLLDQSRSMNQPTTMNDEKLTLAEIASYVINDSLVAIIDNAGTDLRTNRHKDYCDIIIFGYGSTVKPLLNPQGIPISLPDLADNALGERMVVKSEYDASQEKYITIEKSAPWWIEPKPNNDDMRTEMAAALNQARKAVQTWIDADERRKDAFPPIVINITDSRHNPDSLEHGGNLAEAASKLRQIRTNDGNVLLFNCHITAAITQTIIFPSTTRDFSILADEEERRRAEQLFKMSSEAPDSMRARASKTFKRNLAPGARGFMYNASGEDLVRFLTWGTKVKTNEEP